MLVFVVADCFDIHADMSPDIHNGKTRATLGVNKDAPGLSLLDADGKERAILTVLKDGPH